MPQPSSLSDTSRYEQACDQAIAMCDGNLRSTIKALIMANEYLESELQELQAAKPLRRDCRPRKAMLPDPSNLERSMADVTYYVALPFLQDEAGSPVGGAAEDARVRRPRYGARRSCPRAPAASARSPSAAPAIPWIGEFGDAQLLQKFGDVPDDLSGL